MNDMRTHGFDAVDAVTHEPRALQLQSVWIVE
jgi:hypothetical protein